MLKFPGDEALIPYKFQFSDSICPCCHKHYFFPDANTLCPVCSWEWDENADEERWIGEISLDEAKKRFNQNDLDLTNIYSEAFNSLSPSQIDFICKEFEINRNDLFSLSERELDCIYNMLDICKGIEYEKDGRRSDRYKSAFGIQTSIEKYFRCQIGNLWWNDDFSRQDVIMAHRFSNNHKKELEPEQKCGCFCCLSIFNSSEIEEWLIAPNFCDRHGTAICPKCDIDSVIGESSGYPITPEFLNAMNKKWFG